MGQFEWVVLVARLLGHSKPSRLPCLGAVAPKLYTFYTANESARSLAASFRYRESLSLGAGKMPKVDSLFPRRDEASRRRAKSIERDVLYLRAVMRRSQRSP